MKRPKFEELFPIEDFESWLASYFNQTAGIAKIAEGCPIQRWISRKGHTARITNQTAKIDSRHYRLPVVLQNFIDDIDKTEGAVTGREALRILHKHMSKES